jgi:hypothetical protein
MKGILDYCIRAGVWGIMFFGVGMTLRQGNREFYYEKLDAHFPGLKEQYEKKYGYKYHIVSPRSYKLTALFYNTCKEHNIVCKAGEVFAFLREYEEKGGEQAELF